MRTFFARFRAGRLRLAAGLGLTLTLLVAIPVLANLAGSTFEGNDGNLVVNTAGNTDWANAPNRVRGDDLASGSTDNSFGGGTKEDDPNVNVVTGSIPPQKSDLTRFYVASEFATNSNFLYLAWERSNVLGSANMDFELNQKAQPNLTTTGPKTLVRTAGDVLITFDFGGSGSPTLGLLKWVTSGATSQCFSANSLPCWGNRVNLSAAGFAEGAVNSVTVSDPIANVSLPAGTFGEAAVNLTAAGVFPAGTCAALGSAFLKSRASASFPAEVKDFIAPQPVNISNCGKITIIKHTNPRGVDQVFDYTSNLKPNANAGGVAGVDAQGNFSLNDAGNTTGDSTANTVSESDLLAGTYTVTEGADPTGFAFDSVTCSGGTTATSGKTVTITLAPDDDVVCTYVNDQQLGAIKITKTSSKAAGTPLAGATFTITSGGTPISGSPFTTDANGSICVDNLTFGDYSVQETGAPTGYAIDDATAHTVTVDNNATCSDATYVGESISFTDTPLTDLLVKATSQATGGTQSKITCVDSSNANIGNSPQGFSDPVQVDANGLKPGTYTCTVEIDP
jgi:hypothetical protein